MATSGSFTITTNTYAKWTFSWSRTSGVPGRNPYSNISWTLTPTIQGSIPTALSPLNVPYVITVDGTATSGTGVFYRSGTVNGGTSGTKTIYHDTNGAKSFVVTLATGGTTQKTQTYVLDTLAVPSTLTSAPNFNDEENPTISYSSPTGQLIDDLEICMEWTGGAQTIKYRSITKTSGSYTFNLTDAERTVLRNGITTGNSRDIRFTLRTQIGSSLYTSSLTRTISLINYEPTLAPGVYDTNSNTIAVTGDSNTLVRYMSNVRAESGAKALKGATIASQYMANGTTELLNVSSGLFEGVTSNQFNFEVTDSRGFTTKQTYTAANWIPYVKLTASTSIASFTLAGNLAFVIEGNYFDGDFGDKMNSLTITYTLKKDGQTVGTYNLAASTINNGLTYPKTGKYRFEYTIPSLDTNNADGTYITYTVSTTIKDRLSNTITSQELSVSAEPLFSWSKSDFKFTVPVHFERGFTDDTGLKTGTISRTLNITTAGRYELCTLEELGIDSTRQIIYAMMGTISYWDDDNDLGKIYPVPSPALGSYTGAYILADSTKFYIEDDVVYIVVGGNWTGYYPIVRLVIMYF